MFCNPNRQSAVRNLRCSGPWMQEPIHYLNFNRPGCVVGDGAKLVLIIICRIMGLLICMVWFEPSVQACLRSQEGHMCTKICIKCCIRRRALIISTFSIHLNRKESMLSLGRCHFLGLILPCRNIRPTPDQMPDSP